MVHAWPARMNILRPVLDDRIPDVYQWQSVQLEDDFVVKKRRKTTNFPLEGNPQPLPRDLGRSHERVESFLAYAGKAEKRVKATKYIGSLGRSKRNDDRNNSVDKPDTPFIAFSGKSKLAFEFFQDVV